MCRPLSSFAAPASTTCKNVSLELPRDRLIVFTGLSGSGKSSLAFDTIYAEGQRRYVESLSAYARQFLGQMDKPDVDFIEGLSPAISIDQKSASRNPRSTVGTVTEIYDYLRLLYARIGRPALPELRAPGRPPDARSRSSTGSWSSPRARASRCSRRSCGAARASTTRCSRTSPARASPGCGSTARSLELADRADARRSPATSSTRSRSSSTAWSAATASAQRLTESIETALRLGERRRREIAGRLVDGRRATRSLTFSQHLACRYCGLSFEELAPRNFSFNSPYGACPRAPGSAPATRSTPSSSCPTPTLSIARARIAPWAGARTEYFTGLLAGVAERRRVLARHAVVASSGEGPASSCSTAPGTKPVHVPYRNRYGRSRTYQTQLRGRSSRGCSGATPRPSRTGQREQIEGYMREVPCPDCGGARLKPESLAVTVGGHEHRRAVRALDRRARRGHRARSSCPSATS